MEMNAKQRVLKTLNHEEPDKVPYTEHLIQNPKLAKQMGFGAGTSINISKLLEFLGNIKGLPSRINSILPKILKRPHLYKGLLNIFNKRYFNFYKHLGVDLGVFSIAPNSYFKYVHPNYIINEFGHKYELKTLMGQFSTYYVGGVLSSEEKYDEFPKLDTEQNLGFDLFEAATKHISDEEIYVVPGIFNGIFDSISLGLGLEHFSRVLVKNQSFLRKMIADREKFYTALIKKAIDVTGTEVFMIGDDLAYNSGPFISPRYFNKFFLPSYKRISNMAHERGVKLVFHTDGDIRPLIDGLIDCFDSIHPLQASANIDIFNIKEKYGDKVCLEGNVPIELLVHETPQKVADYVKTLIKECAPGGGYMLSSGNSIVPEVPPKNYVAMLKTFRKYRNYPIN
ncbi:MAG: uroporphyrinogen decarboxylase family protein [Promethearchaeia archaeon]